MPVLPNPKHERFARALAEGMTADDAYQHAGYKADRAHASRLAAKGNVQARVEELQGRAAARTEVTVARVLGELAKIGFADIRRAVRWGEGISVAGQDGEVRVVHEVVLRSSEEIDDDTAAAISEVRKTKDGLSIKFHDKRGALVDLGRHLGIFRDKVEIQHEDADRAALMERVRTALDERADGLRREKTKETGKKL